MKAPKEAHRADRGSGTDNDPAGAVEFRRECTSRSRRGKPARCLEARPGSEPLTLTTAAAEYIWLYDYRHGVSVSEIASREGLSVRRVQLGVQRAQAHEELISSDALIEQVTARAGTICLPRLLPLFPIGPYTPQSACPHRGPIEPGSVLCCMICHSSGMDGHPALQRDPQREPSPEPKPVPSSAKQPVVGTQCETRRQRRRKQFAQQESATQIVSGS